MQSFFAPAVRIDTLLRRRYALHEETSLEDSRIEYDVAGQMDQVYTMRDGVLQTGDQEPGAA